MEPIKLTGFSGEQFSTESRDDGSLICTGMLVTAHEFPQHGYMRYKIKPEAFTSPVISEYMQKPVVLWSHDIEKPIGRTLSLTPIKGKGVQIRFVIRPTDPEGKNAIELSKTGDIGSLSWAMIAKRESVSFDMKKDKDGNEYELMKVGELEWLPEVSVVTLGRDAAAVYEPDTNQKFKQDLFNSTGGGRIIGERKMEVDELKTEVDGNIDQLKAIVSDVKKEVGGVAVLQAQVKEFKEISERTQAENVEFTTKIVPELTKAMTKLQEGIAGVAKNKQPFGGGLNINHSVKDLMSMPTRRIKSMYTSERFDAIEGARLANDQLYLVDLLKVAGDPNGYGRMPIEERMKSLKSFKDFEAATFAMDTATSNEGAQYLPTGYSSRMNDLIRVETVVANMFPRFPMTNSIQVLPVEGADTLATLEGETTAVIAAFDSTEQTPGSANVTYTAKKFRGRTQFSAEADEDLIIPMFTYIEGKVARSIGRAIGRATISGDKASGTGYDTGESIGATDARYAWDGVRQFIAAGSSNVADLSTFDAETVSSLRTLLGKYGQRATDLFWLTSIGTYLKHFLSPTEISDVRTLDKYGPSATVVTGELAKYNGSPILVDEWVKDTYNATGILDGVTETKSILLLVNKNTAMFGDYKPVTMEIIRDGINDVYDIIGRQRLDFEPLFPAASNVIVAEGYNIST